MSTCCGALPPSEYQRISFMAFDEIAQNLPVPIHSTLLIATASRASHNEGMTPRELANSICERLLSAGYQALLAGGCVRDVLLGRVAVDYDVATNATPAQVLSIFPEGIAVGAQFGVIVVPREG